MIRVFFCYDKIINMKTLKKEEYKLFLIEKKKHDYELFQKRQDL